MADGLDRQKAALASRYAIERDDPSLASPHPGGYTGAECGRRPSPT